MDRLAGANVAFACVTTEPLEKVKAFASRRPARIPIYVLADDTPPIFETRSIPATFIVKDGDIISQHIGAARWDTDEMVAMLAGAPVLPSARLRAKWERRLPRSNRLGPTGDCSVKAARRRLSPTYPAEDVAGAVPPGGLKLPISFSQIFAVLIRFASDGSCVPSTPRTVISSSADTVP